MNEKNKLVVALVAAELTTIGSGLGLAFSWFSWRWLVYLVVFVGSMFAFWFIVRRWNALKDMLKEVNRDE